MFPMSHGVLAQVVASGAPPVDAFPVIEATSNNDGDNTSDTSHTITMPAGVQAGDLVIVVVRVHDVGAPGGMSGWSLLASRLNINATAIYYRFAAGAITTATLTAATSSRVAWVAYRISGASAIEGAFAGSNTLQPPQVTPSWGAEKTLWLTAVTDNMSNYTFTAPVNYGDQVNGGNTSSSFTSRHRTSVATRELEASPEQPGVWTKSTAASAAHAATIAVRP